MRSFVKSALGLHHSDRVALIGAGIDGAAAALDAAAADVASVSSRATGAQASNAATPPFEVALSGWPDKPEPGNATLANLQRDLGKLTRWRVKRR